MQNSKCEICGGCVFRALGEDQYRQNKLADFEKTISLVKNARPVFDTPILIADGQRRRADMEFTYQKKTLTLGFYAEGTHQLIDVENCPMLTPKLNALLPQIRTFLADFCAIKITVKNKKKLITESITKGAIRLLEADNGVDVLLNLAQTPQLEHRLAVADFVNALPEVVRFSWQINNTVAETIVQKNAPILRIANAVVEIPQGVFLQASKTAETQMIAKVLEYMGQTHGKIADLFCGLGTFTYPLAQNKENEIVAVDSSADSLKGLQQALNQNQIHNVQVQNKNLFKYPFDKDDFKGISAVVIDPPRAGAHDQCRAIAELEASLRPQKIVFVSCNPKTFVYDAETLINAGYCFERVTLIDQFVYSKHQELIALFTFNSQP